jgi:hypothetical protein
MIFKKSLHSLWIPVIGSVMLLSSGCATTKDVPMPTDEEKYQKALFDETQKTLQLLARSAELASESINVYVRTNQAKVQPLLTHEQIRQARFQYSHTPTGMEKTFSFPWYSAPEPYLARLASISGYKLEYTNQQPPIAKSIYISALSRNVMQFINAVEQTASGYIKDITVDEKGNTKTIYVTYEEF